MESPCGSHKRPSKGGRSLALVALLSLVAAYAWGFLSQDTEAFQSLQRSFPGKQLERTVGTNRIYRLTDPGTQAYEGDVVIQGTQGWGGPLTATIWIAPDETIHNVVILSHKETPSFFQQLKGNGFFGQFSNRSITEDLKVNGGIDAVSGATISSMAVAKAVRLGAQRVATEVHGHPHKKEPEAWNIGKDEGILFALFAVVIGCLLARFMKARLFVLAFCILFLGIHMNRPISLSSLASILLGYLPPLHGQPFWWVLTGGVLLITPIMGKNVYCYWMCPFGGLQELLTKTGGIAFRVNPRITRVIKKLPLFFLWIALMIVFITRNPAMGAYEPFATLFSLHGSSVQWYLVTVALFGAFLIPRFWCRFFCPVGALLNRMARFKKGLKKRWTAPSVPPKKVCNEE